MNSLYPVEIEIENLYCFRGTHKISLGSSVYSIVAKDSKQAERSNWLGKSTLLMAFAYALFGWHTKRTDNEIITYGEDHCCVRLVLSDGSIIGRSKSRDGSTKLAFERPDVPIVCQGQAELEIVNHIGVSEENFFAMFFFEQKKIGSLISAKSNEKINIVEGWLSEQLDPFVRLHDAISGELRESIKQQKKLELEYEWIERTVTQINEELEILGGKNGGELQIAATLDQYEHELLQSKLEFEKQQTLAIRRSELARIKEDLDRTISVGKKLKGELDSLLSRSPNSDRDLSDLDRNIGALQSDLKCKLDKHRELCAGKIIFDGRCPVNNSRCPSADWVVKGSISEEAIRSHKLGLDKVRSELELIQRSRVELARVVMRKRELDKELTRLRSLAISLSERIDNEEEIEDLKSTVEIDREKIDSLSSAIVSLRNDLSTFKSKRENLLKSREELSALKPRLDSLRHKILIAKDSLRIVGKEGIQQAIQEMALRKIESKANQLLIDAEIPLQISVTWTQNQSGLEKHCSVCGAQYPTSAKVKQCELCGNTRGPNVVHKLSIEPSNRSGAAEDLAGFALGIAASSWLRASRSVKWATVFIDEPFGALDAHNRAALSDHIRHLLDCEFKSAFIVAHEKSVLNSLSSRIQIVSDGEFSRIE